jgi:hypothetical protein
VDKLKGGVKIENLALIYKKCRGEGVKSEKSSKKTYFQCEVKRIFNVKFSLYMTRDYEFKISTIRKEYLERIT